MNKFRRLKLGIAAALLTIAPLGCGSDSSMSMSPQAALFVTPLGETLGQVVSMPQEITCPSSCTGQFALGTQVTLSAQPLDGYQFAGWGGDCSGLSPSCNLTMTGTKNVSYQFTPVLRSQPAPVISAISPALGSTAGGIPLQISGQNFAPAATVSIGGVMATGVMVSGAGQLTATLPAHLGAWGQGVPVVVQNPDGQMASRTDLFGYYASQLDFAQQTFSTGSPQAVAVGDFNGDQKPDLAVANSGDNNVSVLLGDGKGGFAAAANFPAGSTPFSVAVGDFNGDQKPDLAVANAGGNNVSNLTNQSQ